MPSGDTEDDEPDPWFRPVWEDDSETEAADRNPPPLPRRPWSAPAPRTVSPAEALLAPLAAAQDALARLDARAEAASDPIRTGLIARLAFREAAGWLAARHAWVHPTDLALRAQNLTGRFDTAGQLGRASQAMPNTMGAGAPAAWTTADDLGSLITGEQAVSRALALARLLAALPRRHDPLADPGSAATLLRPLGAADLDPVAFIAWRQRVGIAPQSRGDPEQAMPALLRAATAAEVWMEAGIVDQPDPVQALAVAALWLARQGMFRVIPLPFWAAWPVLGQGEPGALPQLRRGEAAWAERFLMLVAEAGRAGLRELDRLQAVALTGAKLSAGRDRRARLPDALTAVLATPALTPAALARQLAISAQAASRLLASLASAGVVREVTGRKSFRAFAA
jgi:HTH DNA binding domain